MTTSTDENMDNCATQNETAKLDKVTVIKQITRIIRKAGLDYEAWRYVAKRVREQCDLKPKKAGRRLPRILTAEDFRRFYKAVDQANDPCWIHCTSSC